MPKLIFAHHAITVSDVDRSIAFYRDLLHMTLEGEAHIQGEGISKGVGVPGAHLRIARVAWEDRQGVHRMQLIQYLSGAGKKRFEKSMSDVGVSHISIYGNVQETYDELRAKGVKFVSAPVPPPVDPKSPLRLVFMLDPDGIPIELSSGGVPYHHEHVVSDMDRAVAFYRDGLGMKVVRTLELTGKEISQAMGLSGVQLKSTHLVLPDAKLGDEYVELHQFIQPQGKQHSELRLCDVGASHLAFGADNVDQAYEELLARGVKFISPPFYPRPESKLNCTHMVDPDDHFLELVSTAAWTGPLGFNGTR